MHAAIRIGSAHQPEKGPRDGGIALASSADLPARPWDWASGREASTCRDRTSVLPLLLFYSLLRPLISRCYRRCFSLEYLSNQRLDDSRFSEPNKSPAPL